MESQKTKLFRSGEALLLYLTIVVGFYTLFRQSQKLSELSPFYSNDKRMDLGRFYCGIEGQFFYAFRFLEEGKLEAWVELKDSMTFSFPPLFRPQFTGVHYKTNEEVKWTVDFLESVKHFSFKNGSFSSELCQQLGGPSAPSKAAP